MAKHIEEEAGYRSRNRKWRTGVVILGVTGAVVGGLYAVATPFVLPAFRRVCLPYVPATTAQVDNVFSVLKRAACGDHTSNAIHGPKASTMKGALVDLGSGDGRIVIEGARLGYNGTGYELNPWLVWYSKLAARRSGLSHRTSFQRKNLWNVDLGKYDIIVIFGVSQMMEALEAKISAEMKPTASVVACRFPLPAWEPYLSQGAGVDEVWMYTPSCNPRNLDDSRTKEPDSLIHS